MKSRTPASRKPKLHAYLVVANGQEVPIEAEHIDVSDGALLFSNGSRLERAWAEGAWTSVARLAEPVAVPT